MPRVTNEEQWNDLEGCFPSMGEYLDQLVFNLAICGFQDVHINKNTAKDKYTKEMRYIKYNLNCHATQKMLTVYIGQNGKGNKLKYWKPMELRQSTIYVTNTEELKQLINDWFNLITKGEKAC